MVRPDFKKAISNNNVGNELKKLKSIEEFNFQLIPYEKIKRNPNNKYEVKPEKIKEIKESLKEYGLHHNIVIIPVEDSEKPYMLLSGEVRHTAIGELLQEGNTKFIYGIPSKIIPKDTPLIDQKIIIEETNLKQRDYTPEELRKAIKRLNEYIYEKKSLNGQNVKKGEVIKEVSEMAGIGTRQIHRITAINEKLISELQVAFDEKKLTIEKAAQLAQLDDNTQKLIVAEFEDLKNMNSKEIKELQEIVNKKESEIEKIKEENEKQLKQLNDELNEKEEIIIQKEQQLQQTIDNENQIKNEFLKEMNNSNPNNEKINALENELSTLLSKKESLTREKSLALKKLQEKENELEITKKKLGSNEKKIEVTISTEEAIKLKENFELKKLAENTNLDIIKLSNTIENYLKNYEELTEEIKKLIIIIEKEFKKIKQLVNLPRP